MTHDDAQFQVKFTSLFCPGRALTFPCDQAGRVSIDALSERARNNYFYARATIGRDFSHPAIVLAGSATPTSLHSH